MTSQLGGDGLRVLIVEDDVAARSRMLDAIESQPDMCCIGAVGNLAAARAILQQQWPDVLMVDLGLPDGDGTSLIREVSDDQRHCEILVVTIFGDEKHVLRAIESGAGGYLLKEEHAEQIAHNLRHLVKGHAPISPAIARHLLVRYRNTATPSNTTDDNSDILLTEREQEILQLIAKGYSSAEISRMLEVTYNTVTSHVKNIYRKLAVHSRSEAIFEAVQRGLVTIARHE